jgi:hypothetical protein
VNADRILSAFHDYQVDYLLIGGMNFLLRHQPVLTFDIDFWVKDEPSNLAKVNLALVALEAQWGASEGAWAPVSKDWRWLTTQQVYCLTSAFGALDIFRTVRGLENYEACERRSTLLKTESGTPYRSLSDADMLACQMALGEGERRLDRVAYFQRLLGS